MGQRNGKIARSESGVASDDGFSDDEVPDVVKNKKALFNPFFRQLINDCYAQAHADLTGRIIHRCIQQRHDFKDFLDALGSEGKTALKEGLKIYIEDVISRLDDEEAVKRVSRTYGRAQVPLRHCGHKPDFFATMADAIATECVYMGSQIATTTPTNTFKAWTVLVGVMFSAVRDGYYTELRRARKMSPGLEGESRTGLASSKHSSVDSSSSHSNGDRPSPSISSRGSPHFNRSSSGEVSNQLPLTLITVTAPTSSTGSAARRAYRGSRSAAVVGSDGATSSRSCDAICGEDLLPQRQHRDYRLPPQHRSHDLLRAESPREGRFKKNVSLDYDKRRQRLEEIGKKHSNGYLARNSSSSSSVFDPNKIMDAFMNDEPF